MALSLLTSGPVDRSRALEVLRPILLRDEELYWFGQVFTPLMDSNDPGAVRLVCAVAACDPQVLTCGDGFVVRKFVQCGKRECVNCLKVGLEDRTPAGSGSGRYEGQQVERQFTRGDRVAIAISAARLDKYEYDTLAPDAKRAQRRAELKEWLEWQFDRVKNGEMAEILAERAASSAASSPPRVFDWREVR